MLKFIEAIQRRRQEQAKTGYARYRELVTLAVVKGDLTEKQQLELDQLAGELGIDPAAIEADAGAIARVRDIEARTAQVPKLEAEQARVTQAIADCMAEIERWNKEKKASIQPTEWRESEIRSELAALRSSADEAVKIRNENAALFGVAEVEPRVFKPKSLREHSAEAGANLMSPFIDGVRDERPFLEKVADRMRHEDRIEQIGRLFAVNKGKPAEWWNEQYRQIDQRIAADPTHRSIFPANAPAEEEDPELYKNVREQAEQERKAGAAAAIGHTRERGTKTVGGI